MQFKQESSEPFWKYFERFKDLLAQCPHHGIEKWRQCQILYDGLDYQTKTLLETMCLLELVLTKTLVKQIIWSSNTSHLKSSS